MTTKVTPDELIRRLAVIDVDAVQLWSANPNAGDVGAISRSLGQFGQLDVIVVCDGIVVSGNHRVMSERQTRDMGGRLAALDISGLGWEPEEVAAAALALNRTARLGHDDPEALVLVLQEVAAQGDVDLFLSTGYDPEELDRLMAEVGAQAGPLDLSDVTRYAVTVRLPNRDAVDEVLSWLEGAGFRDTTVTT